jgi:hypothetical protein
MAEPTKGRLLAQDQNGELYDNGNIQQLFVDGIGQLAIGPAVSKLLFFKVNSTEMKNEKSFENRELCFQIILPTVALFQSLAQLPSQLSGGIPALEAHSTQAIELIKKFVSGN